MAKQSNDGVNRAYLNATKGIKPEKVKTGYMLMMELMPTSVHKTWRAAYRAATAQLGFMPNTPEVKIEVPVGLYKETAPASYFLITKKDSRQNWTAIGAIVPVPLLHNQAQ